MRISDWSSDVCSSDLSWNRNVGRTFHLGDVPDDPLSFTNTDLRLDGSLAAAGAAVRSEYLVVDSSGTRVELDAEPIARPRPNLTRSEERRVGTGCVSTCRSRGSPYH